MAARDSIIVDDPTDPDLFTPEQRLDELGRLLAVGVRRLNALRLADAVDPSSLHKIPPQSDPN